MIHAHDNNTLDKRITEGTAAEHLFRRAQFGFGHGQDLPTILRFVVLEVIIDPTVIDDKTKARYQHVLGVSNVDYLHAAPRNSIIGQRVLDGAASAADTPLVLFPFFPSHIALPCKPGEHVWVIFEDPQKLNDVGYWMCRIPTAHFVDDVNHTHAPREFDPSFRPSTSDQYMGKDDPVYEFRNGVPMVIDGSRITRSESAYLPGNDKSYADVLTGSQASKIMTYEPVPRFRKRPGDLALEGTNNALIVIGTDRKGPAATFTDGNEEKIADKPKEDLDGSAGCIDIVVGRGQTEDTGGTAVTNSLQRKEVGKSKKELKDREGDPDFANDRSRIYVAQRTKVDKNFGLDGYNGHFNVSDNDKGDGGIIVKSDKVRIVGREDVEIVVTRFKTKDGVVTDETDNSKFTAIIIDGQTGNVVIDSSSKVTVLAADNVNIKSKKDIDVTADGNVTSDGKKVKHGASAQHPSPLFDTFLTELGTFLTSLMAVLQAGTVGSPVKQQLVGLAAATAGMQQFVQKVSQQKPYVSTKVFNE